MDNRGSHYAILQTSLTSKAIETLVGGCQKQCIGKDAEHCGPLCSDMALGQSAPAPFAFLASGDFSEGLAGGHANAFVLVGEHFL